MLFNHEKEKIHLDFVHLNKNERVKEKMYLSSHIEKSQPSTTVTAFSACRPVTSSSKSSEMK